MPITFQLAQLPRIEFGPGARTRLPTLLARYGHHVLIVTGARSFLESPHWPALQNALTAHDITWQLERVMGEPSPDFIDDLVRTLRLQTFDCVLGIGGGSALDAGKAIAGLLRPGNSVMDHLEGVGPELPYHGPSTPFIAVPTTAGTGSEATKNAVLSRQGPGGFKKSFRDEQLVPDYAIVDPDLLEACPPAVIAANGMDAFTQLLESYVSSRSNPVTDALALSGMAKVRDGLMPWFQGTGDITEHRAGMAYAALLSGITLAQVGLGAVHGLAAPLGAFFSIPHGVACGTLLASATRMNLAALGARSPDHPALGKYAEAGRLLTRLSHDTDEAACMALLDLMERWTAQLDLPRLGRFGVEEADVARIVANSRGSSMKTNPVELTDAEIAGIVRDRL